MPLRRDSPARAPVVVKMITGTASAASWGAALAHFLLNLKIAGMFGRPNLKGIRTDGPGGSQYHDDSHLLLDVFCELLGMQRHWHVTLAYRPQASWSVCFPLSSVL